MLLLRPMLGGSGKDKAQHAWNSVRVRAEAMTRHAAPNDAMRVLQLPLRVDGRLGRRITPDNSWLPGMGAGESGLL